MLHTAGSETLDNRHCGYNDSSYLPDIFALHLRPLDLPLISKDSKKRVGQDDREAQAPNKSDGIEEVGVA